MPDYNLLGSTEVLEELQEGRTRELLLLLQDKPVPEVQDPINKQSGLSNGIIADANNDQELFTGDGTSSTASRESDESTTSDGGDLGLLVNPNKTLSQINATISQNTTNVSDIFVKDPSDGPNGTIIYSKSVSATAGDIVSYNLIFESGKDYAIGVKNANDVGYDTSRNYPYTSTNIDITSGWYTGNTSNNSWGLNNVEGVSGKVLNGSVADSFSASVSGLNDFKQWNTILARDVTNGGSTSPEPVEFEILDSSDTALNSTRIPKARIADEPFTMRDRFYSEDATSDGQNDYQITTTGEGGHFGIPVLTVVSVKKNGSVLDSTNWSFDGDTTVTIDTSNVTITSGDTIEIKYDFDVFDSTLQPRAYLSREDTAEDSPSISHFRYEYVI